MFRQFCFPEGPDVSRDEVIRTLGKTKLSSFPRNRTFSVYCCHLTRIFSIYFYFRLKAKFLAVLRLSVNPIETLDDTSQP